MTINPKLYTLLMAAIAGLASFVNWLATVPPETQSGWLANLVDITPVTWRPNVALFAAFAKWGMGIYTLYRATHPTPAQTKVMAGLLVLAFTGCANTVVKRDGKVVLWTQANASTLEFHSGDTSLKMTMMNHSTPTRAGGSVIGTTATGATGVITALVTKGIVR